MSPIAAEATTASRADESMRQPPAPRSRPSRALTTSRAANAPLVAVASPAWPLPSAWNTGRTKPSSSMRTANAPATARSIGEWAGMPAYGPVVPNGLCRQ